MLQIKDKPGCITVAEMREHFERGISNTPVLKACTPLGTVEINGKFSHYFTPETDTMWLGFAYGMRMAERVAAQRAAQAAQGSE
ncbi:hypothetical protein N5F13_00270 [Comamonas thiooxydans]|uniref:hypothetical protein n=1 Tax=Comamonas thiooxydans TaxID=363952 RepID=UPI00244BD7E4|nr:hypothetical protein [Comamonas thiooxydans]MDH1472915.1 hypothetical protein [Comamonas thiooxydans]